MNSIKYGGTFLSITKKYITMLGKEFSTSIFIARLKNESINIPSPQNIDSQKDTSSVKGE